MQISLITIALYVFREVTYISGGLLNPGMAFCFSILDVIADKNPNNTQFLWVYLLSGGLAAILAPGVFLLV
jgi:glycerol uptake facilitator-like aquaporin